MSAAEHKMRVKKNEGVPSSPHCPTLAPEQATIASISQMRQLKPRAQTACPRPWSQQVANGKLFYLKALAQVSLDPHLTSAISLWLLLLRFVL